MSVVENRVIEIVSEQMGVPESTLTSATRFVEDLGGDSLDTVELTMEFEEEFDITIPDEEAARMLTIGQVINYVEKHTSGEDDSSGEIEVVLPPVSAVGVSDATKIKPPGSGFGPEKQNRQVEQAAISFARKWYDDFGWTVKSVERDRDVIGYDLHCTRGDEVEHVEVKGTSGEVETFIITSGEKRRAESDPKFTLFVVIDALNSPKGSRYMGSDVVRKFTLDPISYKAAPRADEPT